MRHPGRLDFAGGDAASHFVGFPNCALASSVRLNSDTIFTAAHRSPMYLRLRAESVSRLADCRQSGLRTGKGKVVQLLVIFQVFLSDRVLLAGV